MCVSMVVRAPTTPRLLTGGSLKTSRPADREKKWPFNVQDGATKTVLDRIYAGTEENITSDDILAATKRSTAALALHNHLLPEELKNQEKLPYQMIIDAMDQKTQAGLFLLLCFLCLFLSFMVSENALIGPISAEQFTAAIAGLSETVTGRFQTLETNMNAKFQTLETNMTTLETNMNAKFQTLEANGNATAQAMEARLTARIENLRTDVSAFLLNGRASQPPNRIAPVSLPLPVDAPPPPPNQRIPANFPVTRGALQAHMN